MANHRRNSACWHGIPFWCGCINRYDGQIEETHTYEEASACDFHHSLYFSDNAAEKIDQEEYLFFGSRMGRSMLTGKIMPLSGRLEKLRNKSLFREGEYGDDYG